MPFDDATTLIIGPHRSIGPAVARNAAVRGAREVHAAARDPVWRSKTGR